MVPGVRFLVAPAAGGLGVIYSMQCSRQFAALACLGFGASVTCS